MHLFSRSFLGPLFTATARSLNHSRVGTFDVGVRAALSPPTSFSHTTPTELASGYWIETLESHCTFFALSTRRLEGLYQHSSSTVPSAAPTPYPTRPEAAQRGVSLTPRPSRPYLVRALFWPAVVPSFLQRAIQSVKWRDVPQ